MTADYPKFISPFLAPQTRRQHTLDSASGLASERCDVVMPCAVANEEHRLWVLEKLRHQQLLNAALILEPVGRNVSLMRPSGHPACVE